MAMATTPSCASLANLRVAVTQRIQRDWRDGGRDRAGGRRGRASLKWATAKVERSSQRGNGDRFSGRERPAERGGDFNEPAPF
jgi:hypothetical protein